MKGPVRQLFLAIRQLVQSWWQVDRVRMSPRDGRLLRLQTPCRVIIHDRAVDVLSRKTEQTAAGPFILYRCRTSAGPAQLQVMLVDAHKPLHIVFKESHWEETLTEDNVLVIG